MSAAIGAFQRRRRQARIDRRNLALAAEREAIEEYARLDDLSQQYATEDELFGFKIKDEEVFQRPWRHIAHMTRLLGPVRGWGSTRQFYIDRETDPETKKELDTLLRMARSVDWRDALWFADLEHQFMEGIAS